MFDKKGSGTINFDEFGAVWKYVTDWQQCFRSFDRDGSGNISKDELKTAITTFGYRFSEKFYDVSCNVLTELEEVEFTFDDFIQCCIVLHTLTQAFSQYDQDRDGVITISYEQFLHMVFSIRT
ncbi:putative programmed cell death protein 6 isoform X1, partial [Penaeus vannamei]